MTVSITFLGGTGTVTGSKYLVRHNGHCLLLDCGLFQGYKQLRLRNWQPLPITPHQIDAVVLTHAHLDHSGYLPLLAKDGYTKAIHCTPGTRDLCAILLPDSGYLQEEDAAYLNRHQLSRHAPALPLYTRQDALRCMKQFRTHAFHKRFEPIAGWHATYSHAGHILGAASVLLEVGGRRILFSGDLGRPDDLLMSPPDADYAAETARDHATASTRKRTCWKNCALPCSAWLHGAAWPWYRCLPWAARNRCCMPSTASRSRATFRHRCRCFWTVPWPSAPPACSNATQTNTASRTRKCTPSRTAPPWCRPPTNPRHWRAATGPW